MRLILLFPLLALTGCLSITRSEYEQANAKYQTQIAEFRLENGDTRVCYGGLNPQISFDGKTYTCPSGMRVVTYRQGVMIARWWQDDERLLP